MNIILTIKAVLNYLYNHLIDLINVRKIVFADGTEQLTASSSSASLFDIKVLSQAIADKGFAFMCHTNTRALLKSDVPTLYNDILYKYNNAESGFTPFANGIRLDGDSSCVGVFYNSKLNRYIIINNSSVGYTEYLNSSPTSIGISTGGFINQNSFCANNILLACSNNGKIYKVNLEDWSYKEILSCSNTDYMRSYILKDDNIYVQTNKNVYRIKDNYDDDTVITLDDNSNIIDIIYSSYYDTFIVAKSNGKIYKTNDFSNYDLLTTVSSFKKLFCYNNKIFYVSESGEDISVHYSEDLFQTQNHTDFPYLSRVNLWYIIDNKAYFYSWYGTTHYIFDMDSYTYSVNTTFTDPVKYATYIDNVSANIIVDSYGNTIHYSNYQKILYTDTYTINGSSVTINYYKYQDFKICLADGGTNDSNLETLFNYLGYLNYWLLDYTNETITIQRNKQGFVMMYVGDDFEDDLENLPTISTRVLPQEQEIVDSSASVNLDVLPNKDYNLINANLSSLTLNSCQYSPLGTTIQFNSGSTPTTITDNTNIDWVDGATPIPSASKTCLIFIWKNKGFYLEK